MNLNKALFEHFQLTEFRLGQKEIITDLLNGKDVLAVLPTGSGKSLCYQLPGLILNGITIVVSPLLSLMEDQVQQLKSKGIKKVVALNSFLTAYEKVNAMKNLHTQKIIYVSPEILQSKALIRRLKSLPITLFVVDEAHCISQWGHEFRTDYLKLKDVKALLGDLPCLAITATASLEVQNDIIDKLQLKNETRHIYSVDRSNIAIMVKKGFRTIDEKIKELVTLINTLEGPGIVYASTRKWTEELASIIGESTVSKVAYYHGGMSNEDRLLIQQQFIKNELPVICCTSAFGMGVNKQNIRYVIHFQHPLQVESYLQEIGRAGRDGKPSIAITLLNEEDSFLQLNLLTNEFPTESQLQEVLECLVEDLHIKETELLARTGITEVMWRFIRYQLEEQQIFHQGFTYSRVSLLATKKLLLEKISSRIQYKQDKLFKFKHWLEQTASCRRKLILNYFDEQPKKRIENCCDICGITLEEYWLKSPLVINSYESWQEELRKIFHK